MKRAQRAVPVILLSVMGFIIFYLVMIYPADRAELLGYLHNNTTTGQEYIHSRVVKTDGSIVDTYKEIGYVGQARGQKLDQILISKVELSYPLVIDQKKSIASFLLSTNLLRSTPYETVVSNINLVNVDSVEIVVDIGEVYGTPKLLVEFNEHEVFYSDVVSEENLKIRVPASFVQSSNTIRFTPKFVGINIFRSQSITFRNVRVNELFYDQLQSVDVHSRDLVSDPQGFGSVIISFDSLSEGLDSKVRINLNYDEIYNKVPFERETIRRGLVGVDVRRQNNIVSFQTEKGGVYTLDNVKFEFYAPITGREEHRVLFDMVGDVFVQDKEVLVTVHVDDILIPGTLELRLDNVDTSYITDISSTPGQVTISINEPKNELRPYNNVLVLSSSDGRFRIERVEFKVRDPLELESE